MPVIVSKLLRTQIWVVALLLQQAGTAWQQPAANAVDSGIPCVFATCSQEFIDFAVKLQTFDCLLKITIGIDCQMTSRGWTWTQTWSFPPDQRGIKILSAKKPLNSLCGHCGVWNLFRSFEDAKIDLEARAEWFPTLIPQDDLADLIYKRNNWSRTALSGLTIETSKWPSRSNVFQIWKFHNTIIYYNIDLCWNVSLSLLNHFWIKNHQLEWKHIDTNLQTDLMMNHAKHPTPKPVQKSGHEKSKISKFRHTHKNIFDHYLPVWIYSAKYQTG